MKAFQSDPIFRAVAVVAPLMAIAPIVLGLSGGWIALHLLGGATALVILIISAAVLPSPWRWYAVAGVIVSIAAISVVTGGGSIGNVVQAVMLVFLGAIYLSCVFWQHEQI